MPAHVGKKIDVANTIFLLDTRSRICHPGKNGESKTYALGDDMFTLVSFQGTIDDQAASLSFNPLFRRSSGIEDFPDTCIIEQNFERMNSNNISTSWLRTNANRLDSNAFNGIDAGEGGSSNNNALDTGHIIAFNQPFSIVHRVGGATGIGHAYEGKRFLYFKSRNNDATDSIFITAKRHETSISVNKYNSSGVLVTENYFNSNCEVNQMVTCNLQNQNGHVFDIIANQPIACHFGKNNKTGDGSDTSHLFPLRGIDDETSFNDLYGGSSNSVDVCALEDNTSIQVLRSDGATQHDIELSSHERFNITGTGSLYSGTAIRITSNKPISAVSIADSNGGEATTLVPEIAMGTVCGMARDVNWIKMITPHSNNHFTIKNTLGQVLETGVIGDVTSGSGDWPGTGSSVTGVYETYITGTSNNGISSAKMTQTGNIIEFTKNAYALSDFSEDETPLMMHRENGHTRLAGYNVLTEGRDKENLSTTRLVFDDNGALFFNGDTTLVETEFTRLFNDITEPLTVNVWFKPGNKDAEYGWRTLLSMNQEFAGDPTEQLQFNMIGSSGSTAMRVMHFGRMGTYGTWDVNQWNNMIYSFDGANTSVIYKNGSHVASFETANDVVPSIPSQLVIGGMPSYSSEAHFAGHIGRIEINTAYTSNNAATFLYNRYSSEFV